MFNIGLCSPRLFHISIAFAILSAGHSLVPQENAFDYAIHGSACLLEGYLEVGSMIEHDIHIFKLEAPQSMIDTLNAVLTREKQIIGAVVDLEKLGRDNQFFTLDPEFQEGTTHYGLSLTQP